MGKALFFDIDGTLVNFQGKMPDSAKQALQRVKENGHLIVICSGRSVCQIYPWLLDMNFDGLIAAAGAYVEYGHRVVYRHHIDGKTVARVCALLHEADAAYSAQAESRIVVTRECGERLEKRFRALHVGEDVSKQVVNNMEIDDRLEQRSDIEKFNFFNSSIPLSEIQRRLEKECDVTAMSFNVPTDSDGEISAKGINKALGIQKFIEHVGIAKEDTVAFGDGANDLDMLAYAQVGVAMGNALDEIKKQADYVTTGIDEDGIAHAMSALGLV